MRKVLCVFFAVLLLAGCSPAQSVDGAASQYDGASELSSANPSPSSQQADLSPYFQAVKISFPPADSGEWKVDDIFYIGDTAYAACRLKAAWERLADRAPTAYGSDVWSLWKIDTAGNSAEKVLGLKSEVFGESELPHVLGGPFVMNDGRIAMSASAEKGIGRFIFVNPGSGEVQTKPYPAEGIFNVSISSSGDYISFDTSTAEAITTHIYCLKTEKDTVLGTEEWNPVFLFGSDLVRLCFQPAEAKYEYQLGFCVKNASDGEVVYKVWNDERTVGEFEFTPDGKHVRYTECDPAYPPNDSTIKTVYAGIADGSVITLPSIDRNYFAFSSDGGWAFGQLTENSSLRLPLFFIENTGSGQTYEFSCDSGGFSLSNPTFSPDGSTLIVQFNTVWKIDINELIR